MQMLSLSIQGMSCEGCVRRIRAMLGKVEGLSVLDVQVGSAKVELDPEKTDAARVLTALEKAGYSAKAEVVTP